MILNAHVEVNKAASITANSLVIRIGRDTIYSYTGLLNYLSGVNNTLGLDFYRPQVEYYVEKLGLIRGKY